jgi:hypothetical protein
MKLPLHKRVDRIKTSTPWEIHPHLRVRLEDFNWMKETIINQEKEIAEFKRRLSDRREY